MSRARCMALASVLACLALALTAPVVRAQSVRGTGADFTLARHSVRGGFLDVRTGAHAGALFAVPLLPARTETMLLGFGGGVVVGGFGDRCLFPPGDPGGECAPKANLVVLDLLVGTTIPGARGLARAFAGPTFYGGGGGRSVGLQGRVDLTTPALAHFGLGAMLRGTYLPSHGGDRLLAWALGGSLTLR